MAATITTEKRIERLAAQLTDVEGKITNLQLTDRRDGEHRLMQKRNRLILHPIGLGAGYAFIAKARGAPASTNRSLCRVLQGGKRL